MVFAKTSNNQGEDMSHYKHLTPVKREKIFLLHFQNKTLTYVGATIHRDKSTVSREIARNCYVGIYSPSVAHSKYLETALLANLSSSFLIHNSRRIFPISLLNFLYIICRLYLGANTM